MSTQAPIPEGHPLRAAWDAYAATDEFANSLRWAETAKVEVTHPHTLGSMWAVFEAGFRAGNEQATERSSEAIDGQLNEPGSASSGSIQGADVGIQFLEECAVRAEAGGQMTLDQALSHYVSGNEWLKRRIEQGTPCGCGGCHYCAYNYLRTR